MLVLFVAAVWFSTCLFYFRKKIKNTGLDNRAREARYRAVIETAHDGFWAIDLNGRIKEVNKAYIERSGYSREELLSMHPADLDATESPAEVAARIESTIRDGTALFTSRHRTKTGEVWDVEISGGHADIEGGRIFAFFRDITERTRAEEQIRRMNLRMSLAAKSAGIGVWDRDLSTNKLIWDDAMHDLYGVRPGDFDGDYESWRESLHPDDRARVQRNLESVIDGSQPLDTEFRIIRPDGEVRHIKSMGAVVEDNEGQPVRITGINYDITEQRLAQTALKESEAAYRAAFRTSPDAININRLADGRYVDVNEGFTHLTGYALDEVIGRTSEEIGIWVDPADREKLVEGLSANGVVENLEAQFRLKDGSTTIALMSACILDVRGVPHILSVTRDISALREAEERLLQAQKMEAVGQLTGGIAHDFNNLLQIIEGNLDLVRSSLPASETGLSKILGSAIEAGRRGAKLTQQLLAFSRKQALSPKVLEVGELIEGMFAIVSRTLGEDISVELKLDPDTAPIFADENQLQNAILNLALNARAAMPNGGKLTISSSNRFLGAITEVGSDSLPPGRYIELSVSDTGSGMSDEVLGHAFEPFFTTKDIGEGSGLGLSMVYGFARQSGGNVALQSEQGVGTTARILLPAAKRRAETGEDE